MGWPQFWKIVVRMQDHWGWIGRFSFEWAKVWCSQTEALYHHILGSWSKLQYRHANATLRSSWWMWLQAAAFWENSREQDGNWQQYQERVSGPQIGRYASERPAVLIGTDFIGKTNSAVARPPLLERVARICLEGVEASSLTIDSFQLSLWKQWTGKYPGPCNQNTPPEFLTKKRYLCQWGYFYFSQNLPASTEQLCL